MKKEKRNLDETHVNEKKGLQMKENDYLWSIKEEHPLLQTALD